MGEAILIQKSSSTGGTRFAVIAVTYPEGSACTCTNGSITLTAPNTGGQAVFSIPSTGTWTVTATNGTDTKSQSVSIITEGQFASVELTYSLILFDGTNGGDNTSVTGGWTTITDSSAAKVTVTATELSFLSGSNGTKRVAGTVNAVDFSPYKTLFIEGVFNASTNSDNYSCRLLTKRDTASSSEVTMVRLPHETKAVVSIDLGAITPRSALWVALTNSSASNPSLIYRCWAE